MYNGIRYIKLCWNLLEMEKFIAFRKVKKTRISVVKAEPSFIIVTELCTEFQIFRNNYKLIFHIL